DWATVVQRRAKPELWDAFSTAFVFLPEPTVAAQVLCDWPGWWCHPDKEALLQAMGREFDLKKRVAIWEKVQTIFYAEAPRIRLVVDLVGLGNLQSWCEGVGMTATIHRFGLPPKLPADHTLEQVTSTTPNDQGLLLELILKGTTDPAVAARLGSTPELCRLGLDILSWQKYKTRLPSLLPLGAKVAHKTGTG